ncbi:MAG: MoaD/ThiS family protein [Deltaproteobacteria bacterium]|nr:MoaD/ThiS family protein [Deltaproteobacteria bacterium]
MVTFVPHAALAALLGEAVIQMEAPTVGALIEEIARRVPPADWAQARRVTLLLNGRNVHQLQGMRTPLRDGDQLWMIVPSGGG